MANTTTDKVKWEIIISFCLSLTTSLSGTSWKHHENTRLATSYTSLLMLISERGEKGSTYMLGPSRWSNIWKFLVNKDSLLDPMWLELPKYKRTSSGNTSTQDRFEAETGKKKKVKILKITFFSDERQSLNVLYTSIIYHVIMKHLPYKYHL